MKKDLLTIIALLFGIALNAQVSVWDGTAQIWTHGSGTEEDPYLIESVQNLAYIAEKTNESIYDGDEYRIMYADTCFLLTVDLDFGADTGLQWKPIGACGANWWQGRFGGNIDGGGHSISNISIANDIADFFGVFGYMDGGSLKNITVDGDEIHIPAISSYTQGPAGIILGCGSNVAIENCINRADIVWERVSMEMGGCNLGGLFGGLNNSMISGCYNYGDISAPDVSLYYKDAYCGGIAGRMTNCEVTDCGNFGTINIKVGDCFSIKHVVTGGISGFMTGTITNCNNNGDILLDMSVYYPNVATWGGGIIGCYNNPNWGDQLVVENCYSVCDINVVSNDNPTWAGGLLGNVADTLSGSVENCYYSGTMTADTIGGIIGRVGVNTATTNCFYINTIQSDNSYGTPKSEHEMKSQEFVDLLNNGGDVYAMDIYNINNGYPVFKDHQGDWVEEHPSNISITIYPNPAKDVVNINFDENVSFNSIEIYAFDGRLVKSKATNLDLLDISDLTCGVYLIKLRMSDGSEFSARLVKQ